MPDGVYIAFDFGMKRIGVACGQALTATAAPLETLQARDGVPDWRLIAHIIDEWQPKALIVGLPTCIDGKELYTTKLAKEFAKHLEQRFSKPVYLSDERLSTKEARAEVFAHGGFKKLKKSNIDSIAACVILEQWLSELV